MEQIYLNAFNLIEGISWISLKKIKDYFDSFENGWLNNNFNELKNSGLTENIANKILIKKKEINIYKEFEKLEKNDIKLILLDDDNYPELLKKIYDPPFGLYVKGDFVINNKTIGVVGTRKPTNYGIEVAKIITSDLANAAIIIISGLARGIDTIAHQAAVSMNNKTIAVLGSGLDSKSIYPSLNRNLVEKIIQCGGAIISEFAIGTPPLKQNFPLRNRIIAGLSMGVVVVEAPEKSGALITARLALEQGREVFAVPGSIFSKNSEGCHKLIKLGAKLTTSADDIFEELHIERKSVIMNIVFDSEEEEKIFKLISEEPISIDQIFEKFNLEMPKIASILIKMELRGWIKNIGNNIYAIKK